MFSVGDCKWGNRFSYLNAKLQLGLNSTLTKGSIIMHFQSLYWKPAFRHTFSFGPVCPDYCHSASFYCGLSRYAHIYLHK